MVTQALVMIQMIQIFNPHHLTGKYNERLKEKEMKNLNLVLSIILVYKKNISK